MAMKRPMPDLDPVPMMLPPFFQRRPPSPTGFADNLGMFLELDSSFFHHIVELIKNPSDTASALSPHPRVIATFDGPGVGKTTLAMEVCRKAGAHCFKLSFAAGTLRSMINHVQQTRQIGKDARQQMEEMQLLWTQCFVQILASLCGQLRSSDEKVNDQLVLPNCDLPSLEKNLLNYLQAIKALNVVVVLLLDDAEYLSEACDAPDCCSRRCSHSKTTLPSCLVAGFHQFLKCNLLRAMEMNVVFWLSGADVNLAQTLRNSVQRFPFCENPDRVFPYFSEADVRTCLEHYLTASLFPKEEFQQVCAQLAGPPKLTELFLQQSWMRGASDGISEQASLSAMAVECYSQFRACFASSPQLQTETLQCVLRLLDKPEAFGGVCCRTIPAVEFTANSQGYQLLTKLCEPLGKLGVCRLIITRWEAHLRQLCPFGHWLLQQTALDAMMNKHELFKSPSPAVTALDPACKKARLAA